MAGSKDKTFLVSYEAFGLDLKHIEGYQYVGTCPFSGKPEKFYVDISTGMWDSKPTGMTGNLYTFFAKFYELLMELTDAEDIAKLAKDRSLPVSALEGSVVYNHFDGTYLIPASNKDGVLTDLGHYRIGRSMVARTKNTKVTLNGMDDLSKARVGTKVYIVEGEWDWYAMKWLLRANKDYTSVVCCVPGAGTFKAEWTPLFNGMNVYSCYDNDDPGMRGEEKCRKTIGGCVQSIKFLEWPELLPDKFDVRDFIKTNAKPTTGAPSFEKCLTTMHEMFVDSTRSQRELISSGAVPVEGGNPALPIPSDQPLEVVDPDEVPSCHDILKGYSEWLKLNDYDPIAYMFGTCFANRLSGDPVWSFLVAPPGGTKTEFLLTLTKSLWIRTVSTLTPASLVSGMKMPDGVDPSIIPQIDRQTLVVKDFTTILTGPSFARDEVFGILRDAYDGSIEKVFGNGVVRRYESSFGLLAGVTPTIDSFQAIHSSLGERFLKYRLDKTISPEDEEERLAKVLSNINQENNMRGQLQELGRKMLGKLVDLENLPSFAPETAKIVMRCARFTAKMRSSLERDKYTEALTAMPVTEVATRLTKQLMKLGIGIALYYDHDTVGDEELRIIRKVALDTAPAMQEQTMRAIFTTWEETGELVSADAIVDKVDVCLTTLNIILRDLVTLRIIDRIKVDGNKNKFFYKPTKNMAEIITGAGLY